jgi:predicted signal transduction protein with EAL and GGDEF domain
VNDSLGHAAGDQLLIIVGQRLASVVGPTDTVARFGGDEFAILVEDVREPIEIARMARLALDGLERVIEVEGREVFITGSIGIAVGLDEPDDLLRNADLAMYEAKGQGKGRYEIFQRHMHEALAQRLELELDLKQAADRDQFVLHFQPIVEMESSTAVGVEALIRWRHPTQGLILPDRFIPIAEESGQIHALGRWVLWEACRRVVEWEDTFGRLQLNVNISGAQIRQASLVREVGEILEDTGLEPDRLILEVTESVLMEVSSSNTERLEALTKLGVQLAVDDFGTGYSSLQYLKRFPFDWLKIAKPFVDGVGDSDSQARIAQAIIGLAHSLEIEVIAEGIESTRQANVLGDLGCLKGQGFHFSPPLPAEEIASYLAAGRLSA